MGLQVNRVQDCCIKYVKEASRPQGVEDFVFELGFFGFRVQGLKCRVWGFRV